MRKFYILFGIVFGACPDDSWFVREQFCYRSFEGGSWSRSWNEAQSYCNTFGADLVDFQNEEEMKVNGENIKNIPGGPVTYGICPSELRN